MYILDNIRAHTCTQNKHSHGPVDGGDFRLIKRAMRGMASMIIIIIIDHRIGGVGCYDEETGPICL